MKHKILLVDDQQELRTLLADSFRSRGYEVLEAADGASLKAAFTGLQPDVALLDLKLPDADGLELLSALKAQWPETEAIVLTGYGTLDYAVEATDGIFLTICDTAWGPGLASIAAASVPDLKVFHLSEDRQRCERFARRSVGSMRLSLSRTTRRRSACSRRGSGGARSFSSLLT